MDTILSVTVQQLIHGIEQWNANVGRKLHLAFSQLGTANSVEEYQQIGIVIREAWIEFGQSIFRPLMVIEVKPQPSLSDAKRLVKYALQYCNSDGEHLVKMAEDSCDLSNRVQHNVSVRSESVWQLLSGAVLCMTLVVQAITGSALYKNRPYYKCPNCGSLRLEQKTEGALDFDGPIPVEVLRCVDCTWYYVEGFGGMSGVGEPPL